MDDDELAAEGLRQRVASEDALGELARELLENPLVTRALTLALEAREKAVRAREVALTALNIPSASDIERLTRRVRSVSQRLEGTEDLVDRVDGRFAALNANAGVEGRLSAIEEQPAAISRELAAIHQALAGTGPARAAQPGARHGRRGVAAGAARPRRSSAASIAWAQAGRVREGSRTDPASALPHQHHPEPGGQFDAAARFDLSRLGHTAVQQPSRKGANRGQRQDSPTGG